MRKMLLGAVAAIAISGPALAADLPYVEPAPLPPPVIPGWTGFYLGIGGGGGAVVHELNADFPDLFNGTAARFNGIGGEGGFGELTGGFDYQINSFVLGILADGFISGIKTTASLDINEIPLGIGDGLSVQDISASYELQEKYGFDVLGRVGYLVNPDALLYVLGGYTWAQYDADLSAAAVLARGDFFVDDIAFEDSYDFDQSGWTVGAGVEARFTPNLSIKAEYRFAQFEDKTIADFGDNNILSAETSKHTGRVALNYKFHMFQ